MPAIVLIGAQWGDEGKGKATDLLGGPSSGWCATRAATTPGTPSCCPTAQDFALHLIPSGILTPGVQT